MALKNFEVLKFLCFKNFEVKKFDGLKFERCENLECFEHILPVQIISWTDVRSEPYFTDAYAEPIF